MKSLAWVLLPLLVIAVAALLYYPPLASGREMPDTAGLIVYSEDRVNLNTAPAAELSVLPGIGAVRADSIVEYRAENGPFLDVKDLLNVTGIGPKILAGLEEYVTIE